MSQNKYFLFMQSHDQEEHGETLAVQGKRHCQYSSTLYCTSKSAFRRSSITEKKIRLHKKAKTFSVRDMHLYSQYSSMKTKGSHPASFSVCEYDLW